MPDTTQDVTFHEFASMWFERVRPELRETTVANYEWQLTRHLLPFFAQHRLSQITIPEVDRFRGLKVRERDAIDKAAAAGRPLMEDYTNPRTGITRKRRRPALGATSINAAITRLGQILEVAVEYGIIDRNPAAGRRRRVRASKAAAVWLDRAEHISALLDAAGELDKAARADQQVPRRAILSTLLLSGLRIGELIDLRWRDVDLAGGRITVRASKTDAGVRQIDLLPALREELADHKAVSRNTNPATLVFPTQAGGRQNPSNIRNRVLARAVARANEKLAQAGEVPLPDRLTPHKLRHTFASLLVALGVDPGAVMDQLGHTDPGFTLRVYRHGMRRDDASKASLRVVVGGDHWSGMVRDDGANTGEASLSILAETEKSAY